jgi:2-oxoglutarate dehydrogenase E2 component (dihydrolipoamide succinyltransferase)
LSDIVVPQLGESVVEARIARWLKKEGEPVQAGEPLVELETEKIDVEVPAERAGVLTSIKRQEGEDVKVGELLGVVDEAASGNGAGRAAATAAPPPGKQDPKQAAQAPASAATAEPAGKAEMPADAPKATPTARRMASAHEVDLGSVRGSGSAGRVMKDDVQGAIGGVQAPAARQPTSATAALTPPPGDRREDRQRMSKRRLTIARRLVEAQRTAAMLTTFNEVDMTGVMEIRQRHKDKFKERHGVTLGLMSFFVKASVAALKAFPRLNAEIDGEEIVLKHYFDIGMAVGAEGGLVVPVLRDVDRMSFAQIEQAIRDFAARANAGTLTLEDLKGGTFTITNGGVYGSLMSTPILNPPQVGILGLHKIADRAVVSNGQVTVRPMMYLALSYDHRIVDGREAVQFLVSVKDAIEDPAKLLIEG